MVKVLSYYLRSKLNLDSFVGNKGRSGGGLDVQERVVGLFGRVEPLHGLE